MVYCAVFGCSAVQKSHPTRSFHVFPKDPKLRKAWINRLNRKDWTPGISARVCSYHFAEDSYVRKRKSDAPVQFQRRKLKDDAVPSCNLRGEDEDTRISKRQTSTSYRAMHLPHSEQSPCCSKDLSLPLPAESLVTSSSILDVEQSSSLEAAIETLSLEQKYEAAQKQICSLENSNTNLKELLQTYETQNEDAQRTIASLVIENKNQDQLIQKLKKENGLAQHAVALLKPKVLTVDSMTESDILKFTGLHQAIFNVVVRVIKRFEPLNYWSGKAVKSISSSNQLLIFLMKMKFNYPYFYVAKQFDLSTTTIQNIFMTYLHVIHEIFFKECLNNIPSVEKHQCTAPESFENIANCRIIIDCTEFFIETPRNDLNAASASFSNYKKRLTVKYLIGVAPNGAITFISDGYPGSTSDKMITKLSGVLDHLEVSCNV